MTTRMNVLLRRLLDHLAPARRGQTLVEYGLILILMSLIAIVLLGNIGQAVIPMFSSAAAGF